MICRKSYNTAWNKFDSGTKPYPVSFFGREIAILYEHLPQQLNMRWYVIF